MFFRAKRAAEHFRLRIEPVGILDGPYFDGHTPIKNVEALSVEESHEIHTMAEKIGSS
jgi:hypothetical protein